MRDELFEVQIFLLPEKENEETVQKDEQILEQSLEQPEEEFTLHSDDGKLRSFVGGVLGNKYNVKVNVYRNESGNFPGSRYRIGLYVDGEDVKYWKRLDLTTADEVEDNWFNQPKASSLFVGHKESGGCITPFTFNKDESEIPSTSTSFGNIKVVIYEADVRKQATADLKSFNEVWYNKSRQPYYQGILYYHHPTIIRRLTGADKRKQKKKSKKNKSKKSLSQEDATLITDTVVVEDSTKHFEDNLETVEVELEVEVDKKDEVASQKQEEEDHFEYNLETEDKKEEPEEEKEENQHEEEHFKDNLEQTTEDDAHAQEEKQEKEKEKEKEKQEFIQHPSVVMHSVYRNITMNATLDRSRSIEIQCNPLNPKSTRPLSANYVRPTADDDDISLMSNSKSPKEIEEEEEEEEEEEVKEEEVEEELKQELKEELMDLKVVINKEESVSKDWEEERHPYSPPNTPDALAMARYQQSQSMEPKRVSIHPTAPPSDKSHSFQSLLMNASKGSKVISLNTPSYLSPKIAALTNRPSSVRTTSTAARVLETLSKSVSNDSSTPSGIGITINRAERSKSSDILDTMTNKAGKTNKENNTDPASSQDKTTVLVGRNIGSKESTSSPSSSSKPPVAPKFTSPKNATLAKFAALASKFSPKEQTLSPRSSPSPSPSLSPAPIPVPVSLVPSPISTNTNTNSKAVNSPSKSGGSSAMAMLKAAAAGNKAKKVATSTNKVGSPAPIPSY